MTTQTHTVTADSRVRLYPETNGNGTVASTSSNHSIRRNGSEAAIDTTASASATTDLTGYDEEQIRLMEEVCIVVNPDDVPVGSGSKKRCMYSRFISTHMLSLECLLLAASDRSILRCWLI